MTERDPTLVWEGVPAVDVTEWPCIDFANSVEPHVEGAKQPFADYSEFVRWAHHEGLLDDAEARRCIERARVHPRRARTVQRRAAALQRALRAVLSAAARGAPPPAVALDDLNAEIGRAMVAVRLVPTESGWRRVWLDPRDDLGWVLGPVARSAADLLVSPASSRLKECPGSPGRPCGFLFVDETRNRSRRWCSGATCGNRSRLHRHYARLARSVSPATERST